ncbi:MULTISPECIES: hypothetical protein [Rhodoferax]
MASLPGQHVTGIDLNAE